MELQNKETMIAKVNVGRVWIKKMPKPDNYGKEFRVSLLCDAPIKGVNDDMEPREIQAPEPGKGIFLAVGNRSKEQLVVKEGSGFYEVVNGDVLQVEIQRNGNFYNTKVKKVIEKSGNAPAQRPSSGGEKKQSAPRDRSGVEVGHATNCAFDLINHDKDCFANVVSIAFKMHDLTKELQKEYKEQHKEMTEYDVCASVGHAMRNACKMVDREDEVKDYARAILRDVVVDCTKYVKGEYVPNATDGMSEVPF